MKLSSRTSCASHFSSHFVWKGKYCLKYFWESDGFWPDRNLSLKHIIYLSIVAMSSRPQMRSLGRFIFEKAMPDRWRILYSILWSYISPYKVLLVVILSWLNVKRLSSCQRMLDEFRKHNIFRAKQYAKNRNLLKPSFEFKLYWNHTSIHWSSAQSTEKS